jgi:hypothetical protein
MTYPFSDVKLGDILVRGGGDVTVRGRVSLPLPVGTMAGFLITGEFDCLLSLPSRPEDPLLSYDPIDYIPEDVENGRIEYAGAFNYWAPHLPAIQSAMGELTYRVVSVRGSVDPAVVVYRGNEVIVFTKSSKASLDTLSILRMERGVDDQAPVVRHSATVIPTPVVPQSVPEEERVAAPSA